MIGKQIKTFRIKKGLSQEELASLLHISRQTISKWENGNSVPDAEMLVCIADLLDVTVNDLLSISGEDSNNMVNKEELSSLTKELAKKNKQSQQIWRFIKILLVIGFTLSLLLILINLERG